MQQRGFTLIELIIVIVILGILAVTAAPKFIDIQSDARGATLQGVSASLQTADQIIYAKSAIAGQENAATGTVTSNGVTINTVFGYPAGAITQAMFNEMMDLDSADWTFVPGTAAATDPDVGSFAVVPGSAVPADFATDNCHALYTEASAEGEQPTITVVSTGC